VFQINFDEIYVTSVNVVVVGWLDMSPIDVNSMQIIRYRTRIMLHLVELIAVGANTTSI
jgi:hypothetical protein